MHKLVSEPDTSPLSVEYCSIDKIMQDPAIRLRLAEILQDAVWAPPWELRWEKGAADDMPSAEGSISAYHNLLFAADNADCLLFCARQAQNWAHTPNLSSLVGYALGTILTDELIAKTHIAEGLSKNIERPRAGDYYLAVTAIQGDSGVGNKPLENFRCKEINGCSIYRKLVWERMKRGYRNGARTFWVRTATGQEKVRGIYRKLNFSEIGESRVKQGATSVDRTVMAGTFSREEEIDSLFITK